MKHELFYRVDQIQIQQLDFCEVPAENRHIFCYGCGWMKGGRKRGRDVRGKDGWMDG